MLLLLLMMMMMVDLGKWFLIQFFLIIFFSLELPFSPCPAAASDLIFFYVKWLHTFGISKVVFFLLKRRLSFALLFCSVHDVLMLICLH